LAVALALGAGGKRAREIFFFREKCGGRVVRSGDAPRENHKREPLLRELDLFPQQAKNEALDRCTDATEVGIAEAASPQGVVG
jgi:hypothetical protein